MTSQKSSSTNISFLAKRCISHLDVEIQLLEEYIQITRKLYEYVGSEQADATDEKELLASVEEQSQKVSVERYSLKVEIAGLLDVPIQQATIRNLLKLVSEDEAKAISEQREKLLQLESVVRQQNHTNSLLIRQTMDLYQRIALELSGSGSPAPTYSQLGELSTNVSSNFLLEDC